MIDILLATYNSERYLREQLDSICNQSVTGWRLIVRDAASTDSTVEIVREYELKDHRIKLIGVGAADAKENFSQLLAKSASDYVMFSDHDDIWLPDKIERSMVEMRGLEEKFGRESPLLVHTDLKVVNEHLHVLSDSLYAWGGLDPSRNAPRQLLLQNVIWGNTMLFNAPLRRKCGNIPLNAVMHDHWVSLIAAVFGHIAYVPEAMVLYRQHGDNVFGVERSGFRRILFRIKKGVACARNRLNEHLDQAAVFAERFGDDTPVAFRKISQWRSCGWWGRRWRLLSNGISKQGAFRTVLMYIMI